MNHIFIFLIAAMNSLGSPAPKNQLTAETVDFSISYQVTNTVKGYSYETRMDVYVDGSKVAQSPVLDQQKMNKFVAKIPTGNHEVKCVLLANYQGEWQERTVANDYSQDFIWTAKQNYTKNLKVKLYFDIDSGVHVGKKPKKTKK